MCAILWLPAMVVCRRGAGPGLVPTVFVRSSNVLVVLNESAHYCGTVLKSTIINLGHPTKAAHFFISVSTWRPVFEGPWFQ